MKHASHHSTWAESNFSCWLTHNPPPPLWQPGTPTPQKNPKNDPQNGPWNFWKPLTADYVAAGAFFFQKNGPHIFTSPELLGTLPQALFFSRKMAPIFLQALNLWVRCRRRFFFRKKGSIFLEAPNLWVRCRRRFCFSSKRG